jgi:DNA polymerase III subunit delta
MNQPVRYDELLSSWSRNQWSSFYVFAGGEDFLMEQAAQRAVDHWLEGDTTGLNLDRFDAGDDELSKIVGVMQTVPFLGQTRVVRIDHAEAFSAKDQDRLVEVLRGLAPDTRVMALWRKDWRRDDLKKSLIEAALELGTVALFWPLFPEQAQRWAVDRAKTYQKTIEPGAAAWLVQQLGEALRPLDQELAKCSVYVGNRVAIELDDVKASFGYAKARSPFEWTAAIRGRDAALAAGILEDLLEEGEEPVRLLALLSRSVRDWLTAKNSGENLSMLAMRFHLRRGEENRFMRDLGRWSEEDLVEGIGACLQAEQAIKTGKENPEMSLTLLTLRLGELTHALR